MNHSLHIRYYIIISIISFTTTITTNEIKLDYSSKQNAQTSKVADKTLSDTEMDAIIYDWLRTLAEVIHLIQKKHYKVTNIEEAMTRAIDALVTTLDPHSSFLDPKAYNALLESMSGTFHGIGVVIDNTRKSKDKFLTIVDTIPGGPSDKATTLTASGIKTNVQPMDKIVEIEGQPLEGMTTEEATAKIRGPRHTKVKLKIMRENFPDLLTFEIPRDTIKEQISIAFHLNPQNIYYLALTTFSQTSARQIEQLIKRAQATPYKGLILDLRNNSGGLLQSAIDVVGLFAKRGSLVVSTVDKTGNIIEQYHTSRDPIASSHLPIVVLINNFTASAAEILAKLLHEYSGLHKEAHKNSPYVVLVGTTTYGKGSVQEVIPISNNSALRLTTALYKPNNKMIQGVGITPDIVVEKMTAPSEQMKWFTKHYGRESALSNSIKISENQQVTTKDSDKKDASDSIMLRWSDRMREMLSTDNQVREAIQVITTLDTIKRLAPALMRQREKLLELLRDMHADHAMDIQEVKV